MTARIRITDYQLKIITGAGLLLIVVWFAISKTTFLLAYGPHGTMTLSQAQGLCDSALGQVSRTMSARAAANCASVDASAMRFNIGGFAGLLAAVCAAAALAWRVTRPAA